jgi:nucleotide-binding universal stress UspA family protein
MTRAPRSPRLAWLVNLFDDPDTQHAHAANALRPLATALGAEVVPIYAMDEQCDALANVPATERYAYTRARLIALLGTNDLPAGDPIIVQPGAGATLHERVDRLAEAVREVDPLFIAVHTHTYRAIDRFLLGSFSEKFFTRSPSPVLVLNPHAELPASFDTIAFATDFSQNATAAFTALLPIARGLGAHVRVEHQMSVRELPLFMSGQATRAQYEEEIAAERARAEERLVPLRVAAEAAGVPAQATIEVESASISPSEGIEERAADRGVAMIAVAAHGDHKRPGNLGSTALWLMRHAQRPVLVFPATTAAR